jgi:hypothetical protein
MDSFLVQKGFSIQYGSRSNYNMTLVSMASLLHMDYLTTAKAHMRYKDFADCVHWIEHNRVFDWFSQNGYRCYNYSVFNTQDSELVYPPFFSKPPGWFLNHGTLYDVIPRVYLPILWAEKQHAQMLQNMQKEIDHWGQYHQKVMAGIRQQAAQKNGGSRFVYAHFLTAHAPFIYDNEGKKMPLDTILKVSVFRETTAYLHAIQATNALLQTTVSDILAHAGDHSVILLLSDHGFRTGNIPIEFNTLNAVYFPDRDYHLLQPHSSHVNLFRILLQKLSGVPIPLLPDSCIDLQSKLVPWQ